MATTRQSTTEVECPLCGKYRGEPSSVEAHISRKTDEMHKGETGSQHREKLQPGGVPTTDESTTSSSSQSSGSDSSTEKEPGAGPALTGPVEEGDESSEESSEEAAEGDKSGPVTIPVPADPGEGDGSESEEQEANQEADGEDEMSLLMLALLGVGAYLALNHVLGGSGANQRQETRVPGV
jgi:hypothetical protein